MSKAFASGKYAKAECDICGFTVKYGSLKSVVLNGSITGLRACEACWNPDHPQLFVNRVNKDDPQGLKDARPQGNLEQQREVHWSSEADIVLGKQPYPR
jgi:ribosome-binding protein aMBF1 (putative translation factor)